MDATATDDSVLAAGVRWLAGKRVTLGVIVLLAAVFAFERAVLWLYGPQTWGYLFLAGSDPSPGWLLAPFAHRDLAHLGSTAGVVLVYGALVERRLAPAAYLGFYVGAGYASTAAQLGAYLGGGPGLGTLGASGAALGLVVFFSTVSGVERLLEAPDSVETGRSVETLFAVTGLVVVALVVANDFLPGVEFEPGTAPLGHLGGMLVGLVYGVVRARQCSERG
jgi:membrane associated rhomboid family serine protease